MAVDELAAVIGVDPADGEREPAPELDQSGEDPLLGLVPHRLRLGPTGENVCDREGLSELAAGVTALVADQVDLHEPRRLLIPVRPGTDRDLGLQQGPGLGTGTALQLQAPALPGQPAVDRGRRHAAQPQGS